MTIDPAIGTALTSVLPYVVPIITTLLVWAGKKLTDAIANNSNASAAAIAAGTFAAKATLIVQATEQKYRSEYTKALEDGKLTKEEAGFLARLALQELLSAASSDLTAMGVTDGGARTRIAQAAIEAEVYNMESSRRNRIRRLEPAP